MVILDECTGSLDQEYSDLIQHMMAHYLKVSHHFHMKDKTVLNVTHKLDMIRDCDRAVLVDSGQIQLIGSVESVV
jgi:ABC-type multidrug transport system fused ATPase/permease subunit